MGQIHLRNWVFYPCFGIYSYLLADEELKTLEGRETTFNATIFSLQKFG